MTLRCVPTTKAHGRPIAVRVADKIVGFVM
jgi:hypothetical protein